MIVLGIDPGTALTGYGVIEQKRGNRFCCIAYGCIKTLKYEKSTRRLVILEKELNQLFRTYKPKAAIVENVFFFKNLKTAMPVSEAKGVVLLCAAKQNIPVHELSPVQVKMAIAGYGRADKKQVQRMVQQILHLPVVPKPDDAADALSLAIAGSFLLSQHS